MSVFASKYQTFLSLLYAALCLCFCFFIIIISTSLLVLLTVPAVGEEEQNLVT